jgi:hypothetical protein
MMKRALLAIALLVALLPLSSVAQAQATAQPPAQPAAQPAAKPSAQAPLKWTDETLRRETYATPPEELVSAVLAPRHLSIALSNASPDKKWFLNEIGDGPVGMAVFSKPFHELGGLFVDFKANRARPLTIRNNVDIQIMSAADGTKKQIQIPNGARVSNATWSPDSTLIAFYVHTPDATHIWVADTATGVSKQLTPKPVLATLVSSFDFSADGKTLAAVVIPDGRPQMPAPPTAPTGPHVKVADDADKNRLRTFPSLMATAYDCELLEWHATGQVVVLDVQAPALKVVKAKPAKNAPPAGMKKIGQPQMVRSLDLSPDSTYLRITRMTKPFSYVVPVSNFGSVDEVWDLDGKLMVELDKRPLNEGVQDDTAPPPDPAAGPGGRGGAGGPGGGIVQLSGDGNSVFMQGTAYDKNPLEVGPKTFVDKVAIKTGEKKRLYESENAGMFERVTTQLDLEAGRYIVSRESPTEIAQYYLVDGGTRTQLTKNEDVTPDLTRASSLRAGGGERLQCS